MIAVNRIHLRSGRDQCAASSLALLDGGLGAITGIVVCVRRRISRITILHDSSQAVIVIYHAARRRRGHGDASRRCGYQGSRTCSSADNTYDGQTNFVDHCSASPKANIPWQPLITATVNVECVKIMPHVPINGNDYRGGVSRTAIVFSTVCLVSKP
jgi:hypothetical protein